MNVRIFDNVEAISEAAAAWIAQEIEKAAQFHLVLSGGSTPKSLYKILGSPLYKDGVDWSRVHFWWGDERFVPPTDPDSNEGMARLTLIDRISPDPSHVHPMYRPGSAEDAAQAYDREIRKVVPGTRFDFLLLGLGPDAHTASLFPGDPSIHEKERFAVASEGAAGVKQRLTLTPPVLTIAKEVLFMAAGKDKAQPLANVMNEPYDPDRFPAQVVACNASAVTWFIDEAAAAKL